MQNEKDLERVQKVALKIILDTNYKSYENALNFLELDNLKDRRQHLSLGFARKCLRNPKMKNLFPLNNRTHPMIPRHYEHFQVFKANTDRYRESPIIHMQNQLNNDIKRRLEQDKLWKI